MIFSFLGHNGAGKSTTMAMLTGMMPATSGACYVYGRNVEQDTSVVHTMTGYCPQHDVLFDELSVYEHLELFCALKNIPKAAMPAEINERLAQANKHSPRHYDAPQHHTLGKYSGRQRNVQCAPRSASGAAIDESFSLSA
jgi:ABC-type multidrug transport system ATPase subunit